MQKTKRRRLISQITIVWIVLGASLVLGASGKRQTFALPNAILLFGNYEDLRVVTPDREQMLRPPIHRGYNGGYLAFPSISPRGDSVAWGFAVDFQKGRSPYPARFALGVHSLSREQWKHFGDFDDIGTTAYSSDGSKIAFVARTNDKQQLLIFDVAKETWTTAPYPTGGLRNGAAMSWSPDDKRLVLEVQHGGLPYKAAQMSMPDADRNSVIAVLELETGNVRILGEGSNPGWSPDGQWIAYYDPEAAKCLLVHPDGTGNRVVKRFKRPRFYLFARTSFVWFGPVWSPDSKQMLFTASDSEPYVDVMLLDLSTGRTTTKLKKALPIFGWVTSAVRAATRAAAPE